MFADAVMQLLNYHGEDATLVRDTGVTRSDDLLTITRTTASESVKVYMRHGSVRQVSAQVGESKRLCYMGAQGVSIPTKNDKIVTSDGAEYNITSVDPRKHGGTIVAFLLEVEGNANG